MREQFDLVVVGSGTAAQTAIAAMRKTGWRIAVIDHRPLGGTCALRGCDPKKMLVSGEEAIDAVRRMEGRGVAGDVRIDWGQLVAFKRSFTDPIPAKQAAHYTHMGVEIVHGLARFSAPDAIDVEGRALKARNVLLATGAVPRRLNIPGEDLVSTSDDFIELETLPRRVIIIGGGYIAAEYSHLAARAGAEVTVLQRPGRLLPHFDPDLVGWLTAGFTDLGIAVHTGTTVTAVESAPNGLVVRARRANEELAFAADLVLHAAGRGPDLDALNLEAGEVEVEGGRLKLNEYLQSMSNPRVFAAGDVAGRGPPLTPVSSHDGRVVAANLREGVHRSPDYTGAPSVAFTLPPIAAVGLSEEAARAQGLKFRVNAASTPTWFTARRLNAKVYGHKVLVDESTDRILGAHLVGPGADEVINLFALAIRHEITATALKGTMFAYPTAASDVGYMV